MKLCKIDAKQIQVSSCETIMLQEQIITARLQKNLKNFQQFPAKLRPLQIKGYTGFKKIFFANSQ